MNSMSIYELGLRFDWELESRLVIYQKQNAHGSLSGTLDNV